MSNETIFIVEDEKHIQELLSYNLKNDGFKVDVFDNGEDLLNECKKVLPDLLLLDIMLPGIDGISVCRELRSNIKTKKIPIIMLTAKSEEFDRVLGLEMGADDYIIKPFSVRELVARVKAVIRRSIMNTECISDTIEYADIKISIPQHEVRMKDVVIDVTLKEFELLKILMINKGKVLSREVLLNSVWGYDFIGETRTVDVHIRYLRKKIEEDANKAKYILTVRGVGYKFINF